MSALRVNRAIWEYLSAFLEFVKDLKKVICTRILYTHLSFFKNALVHYTQRIVAVCSISKYLQFQPKYRDEKYSMLHLFQALDT